MRRTSRRYLASETLRVVDHAHRFITLSPLVHTSQTYTLAFTSCRIERAICSTEVQGGKGQQRQNCALPSPFTHGRNGDLPRAESRWSPAHEGPKATSVVSRPFVLVITPHPLRIYPIPPILLRGRRVPRVNASDGVHSTTMPVFPTVTVRI